MVQKKEQYVYIARCFRLIRFFESLFDWLSSHSFFVSSEEGDLYETSGEDADIQDNWSSFQNDHVTDDWRRKEMSVLVNMKMPRPLRPAHMSL